MKIYVIQIPSILQPPKQPFRYPSHSRDFGIEQDFLLFLQNNPKHITLNKSEADFYYLPVFWTRWILNHDFGKRDLHILQNEINQLDFDDTRTFTVCQNDDGPMIDLKNVKVFLGSRKIESALDAPLLCDPHKVPFFKPSKKYLASFVGRMDTHPIRLAMEQNLKALKSIQLVNGNVGTRKYIRSLLSSYVALCPRGYGGSSFRFYEAMQLGVHPLLIGDIDTRPFKRFINWGNYSSFTNNAHDIEKILMSRNASEWLKSGEEAKRFYDSEIAYGKWCKYVLKELGE
jgi:hypothetical protein